MNLYAESSAVLGWLLGEPSARPAREALAAANVVVSSALTMIECERALIRAASSARLEEALAVDRRAWLRRVSETWTVLSLDAEISERAGRPFPDEPVRTLDAIHLATALAARAMVPRLRLLSLDARVRSNASAMGFEVVPD